MSEGTITEGQILTGVMFNEPMRVITTRQSGTGTVIAGLVGQSSGQFREVTLTAEDIAQLNAIAPTPHTTATGDSSNLLCRPTPWASPTSSTPTSASPSPAWTRCPTSLRPSTNTS